MSLKPIFRSTRVPRLALLLAFLLVIAVLPARAQTGAAPDDEIPTVSETVQVTATRVPEDVEPVPASITVISGEELRARGVTDLPGALAAVAGISVAPGGDNGPAGSVPEIWGLREFDAFLLVVDGVPWGGAFNPALTTLDLNDVDRIEIQRGAAPVLYGATSFVGVIQILRRAPGSPGRSVRLYGGSYSSGGAAFSTPLPSVGRLQQSLSINGESQGFKDDRTGYERGHLLYRAAAPLGSGNLHFDFDGTTVRQDPASPHPRQGPALSALIPLDANHNPGGSHVDEDRLHLASGYDRPLGSGSWSTTLSVTHSKRDTVRGFLSAISNQAPNAVGFEQDLATNDLYFDTHLVFHPRPNLQVIGGVDHLYGRAEAESEDFDYFAPLNGHGVPDESALTRETRFDMEDERNFSGLYVQTEWTPVPRLRLQVGARLNRTLEEREAGEEELTGGGEPEEEEGKTDREVTRGSGMFGVSWLAWQQQDDALWLYADYRDTYKPAALDFGPEAEADILEPETATSYEVGAKGRHLGGRFSWQVSGFSMDFENLVVAQTVNGLPALVNAGSERFRGAELETETRFRPDLLWRATYSRHDAKFRDFAQAFDGVLTQLSGNRFEMSARDLASTELLWLPARGLTGSLLWQYVGDRFLNKRNTALAPAYDTWSATLGYRFANWEIRLEGENLNDERAAVAESELGDAQYYRLPARRFRLSWAARY